MATILLVNDNPQITLTLSGALDSDGYRISSACSAKEALELLKQIQFDLVVTDLHMPEVDGIRLARIIRSGVYQTSAAVPIILISATVDEGISTELLEQSGINEFIHLPCSMSFFADSVRKYLVESPDDRADPRELNGRAITVLAVDDEPDFLNLLTQSLEGLGFRLLTAENGAQALAAVEREPVRLVLLDYLLPDVNGVVLLKQMRQVRPDLLVVMLTGNGSQEVAVEALWAGAADYLEKPVQNKTLRRTITDVLLRGNTLQMATYLKEQIRLFREQAARIEGLKRLNEAIVGSLPDPICVLDTEQRIVVANPGFWSSFGLTCEPGPPRPLSTVLPHPWLEKAVGEVLRAGRPISGLEFEHGKGDGVLHSYRTRLMPLLGGPIGLESTGEVCAVAVFQDISEERRAARMEDQLRSEQEQTRMMATFVQMLSGAAHGLNNPLAVVMGLSDLGRAGGPDFKPDQAIDMFNRIFEQSKRCQKIVRDLTSFLATERMQMRPGNVYDVLGEALAAKKGSLESCGVAVRVPARLPLPKASMSERQVQRVFEQLLDNAAQAIKAVGKGGEVRISLGVEPGHPNDLVFVEMSNDGPPIADELLQRIFLPFVSSGNGGSGPGLGLAVCYGIVRNHGGKIRARNLPEGGCAFTVWLPVASQISML